MNRSELDEALKEIEIKELLAQKYRHNLNLQIISSMQNLILLFVLCYMVVNYSAWWLLLIILWSNVKTNNDKEDSDER